MREKLVIFARSGLSINVYIDGSQSIGGHSWHSFMASISGAATPSGSCLTSSAVNPL